MNSFVALMFVGFAFWAFSTVVPQWPWALSSWQFRSPDKMMPSARRWRVFRAHSAVLTVFFGAGLVLGLWPGTRPEAAGAALTTLLVGDVLLLVWWLVTVFSRRHEQRLAKEAGDIPPNEPSEEGYLALYFSVGFTVVALAVLSFILYGLLSDDGKPDPMTPEEQAAVDEVNEVIEDMYEGMTDRAYDWHIEAQVALVSAAPEGAIVASPLYVAVLDAVAREPEGIWKYSSPAVAGTGTTDELLAGADIVVGITSWQCEVPGIVVVETAETVTVGLIVTLPAEPSGVAPSPSPDASQSEIPECEMVGGSKRTWYPIDLQTPMGDRELVTVGGATVSGIHG